MPENCLPAGRDWEDSGCSIGNSALYLQGTQKYSEDSNSLQSVPLNETELAKWVIWKPSIMRTLKE